MAQDYVFDVPADFADIPTKRFVVPLLAADPGSPVEGALWYNTTANELRYRSDGVTVAVVAGALDTEGVRDTVAAFVVGGATLQVVHNDGADTLTLTVLDSPTVAGATPAQLRDRSTHTGTQTAATISDFNEAAQDAVGGIAGDTATLDLVYNDAAGTLTGTVLDSPTVGGQTAAQIQTAVTAAIVDGAPGTLDTLNEIAAALGDDPNAIATLTAAIGTRGRVFEDLVGDGVATVIDVAHNLNNLFIEYSTFNAAAPRAERHPGAEIPDANTLRLTFSTAPATDSIRVTVVGR